MPHERLTTIPKPFMVSIMTRRRLDIIRAQAFYTYLDNDETCVYCGEFADNYDHFLPISVAAVLQELVDIKSGRVMVPACGDCNRRAGNEIFNTIATKRRFIQARLKQVFHKELHTKTWEETELEELGPDLRKFVEFKNAEKLQIQRRINWRNQNNSQAAKIARVRLRFGEKRFFAPRNASRTSIIKKERKS